MVPKRSYRSTTQHGCSKCPSAIPGTSFPKRRRRPTVRLREMPPRAVQHQKRHGQGCGWLHKPPGNDVFVLYFASWWQPFDFTFFRSMYLSPSFWTMGLNTGRSHPKGRGWRRIACAGFKPSIVYQPFWIRQEVAADVSAVCLLLFAGSTLQSHIWFQRKIIATA